MLAEIWGRSGIRKNTAQLEYTVLCTTSIQLGQFGPGSKKANVFRKTRFKGTGSVSFFPPPLRLIIQYLPLKNIHDLKGS